ncbi:glycosyltransferase family 4 protein [Altererythrobacter sp. GH1-8]|uniref:glycosyltransferase family 4 protein n=1 Tax=Altererythrobacter sp. GH1-8 TaxID=3349333 RepID=UPI00374D4DF8
MRILLVAPQPFFIERGTPIAVRYLAESLGIMGHEVDLLTTHLGEDVDLPGVTIHRARGARSVKSLPIGFSPAKLMVDAAIGAAMFKMVRAKRYDVIHAVEESVFLALPLCRGDGPRLVYDMDSVLSDQLIEKYSRLRFIGSAMEALEKRAVGSAELVMPVCEAIADRARGWGARQVHVLPDIAPAPPPNDLAAAHVPSIRESETRPLALYVGNLDHYQGIGLLLDSLAILAPEERPDVAIIGGNEPSINTFTRQAATLGLDRDVRFLGPRPLADLMHYLAQADILCSPRIKGINTPMKVYAYMASGVPVVATDILSHTQVLDNSTAYLGDLTPNGYAQALRQALRSDADRKAIGTAAAARAKQEYGLDRFRQRLSEAYRLLEQAIHGNGEQSP